MREGRQDKRERVRGRRKEQDSMKVFTVAIQKGGVGKTTTASMIAAGLHKKGYKTICIDMDAQGNLSSLYDLPEWNQDSTHSVYGMLQGKCTAEEATYTTQYGFDIIPGVIDLAAADMEFTRPGREYLLRKALKDISGKYDVAVIDTAPTLGITTVNALTAADTVIIPVFPDAFALAGLTQLHDTIQTVKEYCNPDLKIGGILLTRVDHTNLTGSITGIMEDAARMLETKTYKQTIRQAVAIRESQFFQTNLLEQGSAAAEDYLKFIDELEGEELK